MSLYIHNTTLETKELSALKQQYNASIPDGQPYGDWQPVVMPVPGSAPEGYHYELGDIKRVNGEFHYEWNLVQDPVPEPYVPERVTRGQAKVAIYSLDPQLYADINAYIDQPDTPFLHKVAWNEADYFERNSPTLQFVASMKGLTPEALDALFIAAAQVVL